MIAEGHAGNEREQNDDKGNVRQENVGTRSSDVDYFKHSTFLPLTTVRCFPPTFAFPLFSTFFPLFSFFATFFAFVFFAWPLAGADNRPGGRTAVDEFDLGDLGLADFAGGGEMTGPVGLEMILTEDMEATVATV